jgi:translation initiation factor IF-2
VELKRLSQAAKELNVSVSTIVEHLSNKYHQKVENNPNAKITMEQFNLLSKDFEASINEKKEARNLNIGKTQGENIVIKSNPHQDKKKEEEEEEIFIKNNFVEKEKTVLSHLNKNEIEKPKKEMEVIKAKLPGLTVLDKIDLSPKNKYENKKQDYHQHSNHNKNNSNNSFNKPKDNHFVSKEEPKAKVEVKPNVQNVEHPKKELETVMPEVQKTTVIPTPEVNLQIKPTQEKKVETVEKEIVVEQVINTSPINSPIIQKHTEEKEPVSEDNKKNTILTQDLIEKKEVEPMEKNLLKDADTIDVRKTTTVSDILKFAKENKGKEKDTEPEDEQKKELIEAKADALPGLKILGKIELPDPRAKKKPTPIASSDEGSKEKRKRKRKRIRDKEKEARNQGQNGNNNNSQNGGNNQNNNNQNRNNNNSQNGNNQNNNNQNRNNNNSQNGNNQNNNNQNRNNNNNQNRNNNNQNRNNNNQNRNNNNSQNGNNQNNNNQNNNNQNRNNNNSQNNNNQNNNNQNRNNNGNNNSSNNTSNFRRDRPVKEEISEKEIQDKIKNTLAILNTNNKIGKSAGKKFKKEKLRNNEARNQELREEEENKKLLQVTEFISANDLANLLHVSVNEIIAKCLSFGMFVAINQRLDAEAITFIADEFGYAVEFISAEQEISVNLTQEDKAEDLVSRAPIVTIMGHVDHGKTSLLDYIRKTNVTKGEAGGITQHIGAYDVTTSSGKRITFLDTPGHEAFTAMRARGAKVTDVAIIVVAADDSVMPQTVEAINHAQVAGVPMVFAINKVDKENANPTKIKEALANMNLLVEDWGGRYQSQEISAKKGLGIEDLLEKILIEAEMLDLKANPNKPAVGTVIEASLDKGKGYLATVLVESGTLKVGDMMLAGSHYGKVKAMLDHKGNKLSTAGPATPIQVLGLNGAPQAGDKQKK